MYDSITGALLNIISLLSTFHITLGGHGITIHYTERIGSIIATELTLWLLITLNDSNGAIYNSTTLLPSNAPYVLAEKVCESLRYPPDPLNYSALVLATVKRYGILSEYYEKALSSRGLVRLIYAYAAWAHTLKVLGFPQKVTWAQIPPSHKLLRCLAFIYENDTELVYGLVQASKFTKPLNGTLVANLNLLRAFIAYAKYYKKPLLKLVPKILSFPCKDVWPNVLLASLTEDPMSCSLKLGYSLRSVKSRSGSG